MVTYRIMAAKMGSALILAWSSCAMLPPRALVVAENEMTIVPWL